VDCNYLVTSFMDIDSLSGDILHDEEPVNYAQYDAFVNPEDFVENIENVSYISNAMSKLKNFEKKVVYYYYFKGKTLREIGALIGVTESRVSQIHKKALESLKKIMQ
jgi:RNA polymerase sigma factor for flagellar operon FliA